MSFTPPEGASSLITFDESKRYQLFIVDEPQTTCGRIMGKVVIFCRNVNRMIDHRDDETEEIFEGHHYVSKYRSLEFREQSITSEN